MYWEEIAIVCGIFLVVVAALWVVVICDFHAWRQRRHDELNEGRRK